MKILFITLLTVCLYSVTQEMSSDYVDAVRIAILNYILMEKDEQERLGVALPDKPSHCAGR